MLHIAVKIELLYDSTTFYSKCAVTQCLPGLHLGRQSSWPQPFELKEGCRLLWASGLQDRTLQGSGGTFQGGGEVLGESAALLVIGASHIPMTMGVGLYGEGYRSES